MKIFSGNKLAIIMHTTTHALLFLIFLYKSFSAHCADKNSQIECDALVCFARSLGHDYWILSDGWLGGQDFCTWHGVGCSTDGHVTALKLYDNNLAGSIPECIGNLTQLEILDLHASNSICYWVPPLTRLDGSTLPESLYSLSNLQYVDLGYSGIGGTISNKIADLSKLSTWRFSVTNLSGTIPQGIENLSELSVFKLERNPISGTLPNIQKPLKFLLDFAVDFDAMSGTIPDMFDMMPNLQHLVLDGNNFIGTVPTSIGRLTQLQELGLNLNNLSGKLPSNICNPFKPSTVGTSGDGTHCHIGSDTNYGSPYCANYPWIVHAKGNKFDCPLPACAIGDGICNSTKSPMLPCQ